VEYIETAKTVMEITKMKKAESLSIKKPKFKIGEYGRLRVKVLPNIIDNENTIPKMDEINELTKAAFALNRSFL